MQKNIMAVKDKIMPEFKKSDGFKMKGWSGWSPLKTRKELREAKREAKATGDWKKYDKEEAGWDAFTTKKKRKEKRKAAKKEYREVKRSIRKGEFEGKTKKANIGGVEYSMTETPSEALLKAKQKINTAKLARKQSRKVKPLKGTRKQAKNLPSSSHLDPENKISETFRKRTGIDK